MFTLFTPFRLFKSLDFSHLTFLYVVNYVALLKNIYKLTLHYSALCIICRECIF